MDVLFKEMNSACKAKFERLKRGGDSAVELLKLYEEHACRWISEKQKEHGEQDFLQMGEELLKFDAADAWVKGVHKGEYNFYLYLSFSYFHLSMIKHNANLSADGCRHLQDAMYYCGAWDGARERDEWDTHCHTVQLEQIGIAKKAGESRGEKYTPIKAEVVRLLKAKVPEGGWKNKNTAVNEIKADLWFFIQSENKKIKSENALLPSYNQKRKPIIMEENNLERTVQDWSRNDENIKQTFSVVLMKGRK
ncbi:TPA: hypothetical protein ACPZQN_001739 [Yersinia enterocolitica]|nr:hypothetical protein [Yersinia enterocolitica]